MVERLKVKVKFFSKKEGGRSQLPPDLLSTGVYRPHLVVGSADQKQPFVDAKNRGVGDYLGVAFVTQDEKLLAGKEVVSEVIMPYEDIDYSALCPGVTFTIREGGSIVGNGHVL